jgi:hypothetical protein
VVAATGDWLESHLAPPSHAPTMTNPRRHRPSRSVTESVPGSAVAPSAPRPQYKGNR